MSNSKNILNKKQKLGIATGAHSLALIVLPYSLYLFGSAAGALLALGVMLIITAICYYFSAEDHNDSNDKKSQ